MKKTYLQVAPDSSGQKVLNLQLVIVDPETGKEDTVIVQAVGLVDRNGNPVDFDLTNVEHLLGDVRDLLEQIKTVMAGLI